MKQATGGLADWLINLPLGKKALETRENDMIEPFLVPESDTTERPDFQGWVLPALKNCWYLTGATSSGKSPLALAIAQRTNAEIISMDSMAIYKGMNIGTAKPTLEDQRLVPHHQLDIVVPSQTYSLSEYVASTHKIAAEIHSRGRNVLICVGTPLYLKSLLRGLFLGPAADWQFRKSVEQDIERYGTQALQERLKQVDPILANKLHPNDHRRMIRALEVARITGRPLSHWQEQFETPAAVNDCPSMVLKIDRAWLHELINARVLRMLEQGFEQEVVGLVHSYGQLSRTARQAVGYREMLDKLAGNTTASEMIELIRAHTRQFARRQEIWFRGLSELHPLTTQPGIQVQQLAEQAIQSFSQHPQPNSAVSP
ncbi:MAG TPA: tRNA (adenosine(37)-N6)-dimethylallyltransferase MiaA [Planctomycetaceae bacterium]|nr:tRNA (adenosine(37)-N6)-dimethylallyltransferase MiaA [Planctomycetaceae bacterium]